MEGTVKLSELAKGAWISTFSYTIGHIVDYQGSSYICVKNSQNFLPTNTTYWALLASKGEQGEQGIQGIQGIPGIQWKGDWDSSTSYVSRDMVYKNGNAYICIASNTNQSPPNLDYWNIVVSKGADGTGTGDVVGPASSVTDRLAIFNGTTGKLLKDSGQTINQIKASSVPIDAIDTDPTLSANSDQKVASQKAIKAYAASKTGVETLTNKRINPRVVTAPSYTTNTGTALDVSTCDEFDITAQNGALKLNNPSGTPLNGQKLIIRIKDNGTAVALTYDTQFRASSDLPLPASTVVGKTLYMGFIFNSTDTKWDLLAVLGNI